MPWYRFPDGTTAHLRFGGKRALPHCREPRPDGQICACIGEFQCDWKLPGGKTCDRHLCAAHAHEVAKDKHLCPEHQAAYQRWLEARATSNEQRATNHERSD